MDHEAGARHKCNGGVGRTWQGRKLELQGASLEPQRYLRNVTGERVEERGQARGRDFWASLFTDGGLHAAAICPRATGAVSCNDSSQSTGQIHWTQTPGVGMRQVAGVCPAVGYALLVPWLYLLSALLAPPPPANTTGARVQASVLTSFHATHTPKCHPGAGQ